VACVDWHPRQKNVVTASCVENISFDERVDLSGKATEAYTLVWSFADLIHPQLILQSPAETIRIQYNPNQPNIIAAGCVTGQVLIWDTTEALERISKQRKGRSKGDSAESAADLDDDKLNAPVKPKFISTIDDSHKRAITDLQWLPDKMEVNAKGVISYSPDVTNQFMTTSSDGSVHVWDLRFQVRSKCSLSSYFIFSASHFSISDTYTYLRHSKRKGQSRRRTKMEAPNRYGTRCSPFLCENWTE
jgi:dynein intermediate chain 3, axonemal